MPAFAESVDTAWVRTYNSPANDDDDASAIAVDDSGYVYVTGYSTAAGNNQDYATVKYNPNGDSVWVRRYNGPGNGTDEARALTLDNSYNVYVTGRSTSSGLLDDYATIKYFPNGDTAWIRSYNGPAGNGTDYDYANAIAVDDSGYVYVTGKSMGSGTGMDYATIKYNPNGDTVWVRRYNGPGNSDDWGNAIGVDGSGNAIVTGTSNDTEGSLDYVTIKYAPNGDTLWLRRYKGPGENLDEAYALAIDSAGNVYVTGYSFGSGINYDYATIKYYPNGDTAWVRRYDGPTKDDYAKAIAVDNSGCVYVTGFSDSTGSGQDYVTIKYDSAGNEVWVRRYNGPNNGTDEAIALAIDKSSNIYVTGFSESGSSGMDYATIKYYSNGDTAWVRRYDGPASSEDFGFAIAVDVSGNSYVTGFISGGTTNSDYCTIKYAKAVSGVEEETGEREKPLDFALSQNYPNPFNPSTTIKFNVQGSKFKVPIHTTLKIYNLLGQKVKTLVDEEKLPGNYTVQWDGKNDSGNEVASGIYFYQLKADDFSQPKKMLLLK